MCREGAPEQAGSARSGVEQMPAAVGGSAGVAALAAGGAGGGAGEAGTSVPTAGAAAGVGADVMPGAAAAAGVPSPAAMSAAAGMPAAAAGPAALGAACLAESDCAANHCVDGVCCEVAGCGECQRCNGSGRCELQPQGTGDDSCTAPRSVCSADGRCTLPNGAQCESGTPYLCVSGHCETIDAASTEGVCVESACGVCELATKSGDACLPLLEGSDLETCSQGKSCSAGKCVTSLTDHTLPVGDVRIGNLASAAQLFTPETAATIFELRFRTSCRGPVTFQRADAATYEPTGTELGRTSSGIALEPVRPGLEHQVLTAFPLPTPLRVVAGEPLSFTVDHSGCYSAAHNLSIGGETMSWNETGRDWELTYVTLNYTLLIR